MSSLPNALHSRLLQELECPVCKEYMVPPIILCNNGHNLCCNCRITLENCPICKGPFLKVRNLSLESLSHETLYPCKNNKRGCPRILTKQSAKYHISECMFDIHKCPFEKISGTGCGWAGSLEMMKEHVERAHKGSCVQPASQKFKSVLHNVARSQRYYQAAIAHGELFYVSWRVQGGVFYCAVFYVGAKDKASNYKYRFSITTKDEENVSVSSGTHSYSENVSDIVRQGKCAMINYNIVQRACTEYGDLPFRMEISEV